MKSAKRLRSRATLTRGIGIFAKICVDRVVCLPFPRDGVDRSFAAARLLALGAMAVRSSVGRRQWIDFARDAFAGASDEALARYVLPEAASVLAESDPERARTLLRFARNAGKGQFTSGRWMRIGFRLSRNNRFSLATTCAYLGDAESVAFLTAGLRGPKTKSLKRRFAVQQQMARKLETPADFLSVYEAARRIEKDKGGGAAGTEARRRGPVRIGILDGYNPPIPSDVAVETVPVDRDFLLDLAAVDGPVWLPVGGSLGQEAYPGHFNSRLAFPFPGNVRPLFLAFHFAEPRILGSLDSTTLDWFRRFMPIGCRDLFTARLLRGVGIAAFVGESELPQTVLEGILKGWGEAKVYALWREAVAPAMARTDALIAECNAKYPLQKVRLEKLGLDQIPVRVFGSTSDPDENAVHLAFAFDENFAEVFPGTFEGIWRHTTRPLVVHIFGRRLITATFEQWAAQFVCNGDSAKARPSVRFIWHDLSGITYGDVKLLSHVSISTMDRLLAPELLPDLEKVVYLDVDILVRKDVFHLFNTDLGDALLAGVADFSPDMRNTISQLDEYGGDNGVAKEKQEALRNAYFSGGSTIFEEFLAGGIVMNLSAMRRERIVEKTLALVRTCGVDDNIALCFFVRGHWKPLAGKWNINAARDPMENPAIVHFMGKVKPWLQGLSAAYWSNLIVTTGHVNGRAGFWVWRNEWRENARRARERGRGH